jgi:hypothetical protein
LTDYDISVILTKYRSGTPMSVYSIAQTTRYRITLDIEALQDFDPSNIDWTKLFELQGKESCQAYVENLSDDMW